MRRLGFILTAILVALVGLWIGLARNFPGEMVSRYIENRVNRSQGFTLVLTPAELRWNRLYIAKAELRRKDNAEAAPLFILTDFAIPVSWRLVVGLPARAVLGKNGVVEAFLPWQEDGEAWFEGSAMLEEVALPAVIQPVSLQGNVTLAGRFQMSAAAQAGSKLPEGRLSGRGSNLLVSGIKVGREVLPPARFDTVELDLRIGDTVNIERLGFQGDLQGDVSGRVTPNLTQPRNSRLALRINAAIRKQWLAGLGTFRPIVESYLKQGRISLSLDGTVGRPRLRPRSGGR